MQSVSSRIWTRVAVSISYDDNNYTTGTTAKSCLYIYIKYMICQQILLIWYLNKLIFSHSKIGSSISVQYE